MILSRIICMAVQANKGFVVIFKLLKKVPSVEECDATAA